MRLVSLGISNLRNIASLRLTLAPGLNVFIGPNGSGKTSLVEAAYLLSHSQSFRAGSTETVLRRGCDRLGLQGVIERRGTTVDLRLVRAQEAWSGEINGLPAPSLGALLREFGLVCLEPGSHALISGGSGERRRFLDWGVFHVEPDYLVDMRRYNRVLKQRNAALKAEPSDSELDAWDTALSELGEPIERQRRRYFEAFAQSLIRLLGRFLPELGDIQVSMDPGWAGESLAAALAERRRLDRMRGHTSRGPHRADWSLSFANAPIREHLSRGQEKLCALACVLAQAERYAGATGEWPVVALDDLPSELDLAHQRVVVDLAVEVGAQVLITGTEMPAALRENVTPIQLFHVEHGEISSGA